MLNRGEVIGRIRAFNNKKTRVIGIGVPRRVLRYKMNVNKPDIKVEGTMSEAGTNRVVLVETWGRVLNAMLWRIGLLFLLYRSPELATVLVKLL